MYGVVPAGAGAAPVSWAWPTTRSSRSWARPGPSWSTTASSASSHSRVSCGSMSCCSMVPFSSSGDQAPAGVARAAAALHGIVPCREPANQGELATSAMKRPMSAAEGIRSRPIRRARRCPGPQGGDVTGSRNRSVKLRHAECAAAGSAVVSNGVSNRPGIPDGLAKSSWNHDPRVGGSSPSSGTAPRPRSSGVFWLYRAVVQPRNGGTQAVKRPATHHQAPTCCSSRLAASISFRFLVSRRTACRSPAGVRLQLEVLEQAAG